MVHDAMSLRPLEAGFAALFVLTVAAKILAAPVQDAADQQLFAAKVGAMLRQNGYAVGMTARPAGLLVEAARGGCRMTVRDYVPDGTLAAAIADQARAIGPLRFAYRGALSTQAPKVRPLLALYWRRVLQRIGMTPLRQPIAAIAAAPACDVAALPWEQLASLPR